MALRQIEIQDPQYGPSEPPVVLRALTIDLKGDGNGPALKAELEKDCKRHAFQPQNLHGPRAARLKRTSKQWALKRTQRPARLLPLPK